MDLGFLNVLCLLDCYNYCLGFLSLFMRFLAPIVFEVVLYVEVEKIVCEKEFQLVDLINFHLNSFQMTMQLHLVILFFFCPLDFFVLIWLLYFSGVMILVYIFELYLDLRQRAALKLPTVPKPLAGIISQEKYEKSRAYSLDKKY